MKDELRKHKLSYLLIVGMCVLTVIMLVIAIGRIDGG